MASHLLVHRIDNGRATAVRPQSRRYSDRQEIAWRTIDRVGTVTEQVRDAQLAQSRDLHQWFGDRSDVRGQRRKAQGATAFARHAMVVRGGWGRVRGMIGRHLVVGVMRPGALFRL